jgi:hypothetical protein
MSTWFAVTTIDAICASLIACGEAKAADARSAPAKKTELPNTFMNALLYLT